MKKELILASVLIASMLSIGRGHAADLAITDVTVVDVENEKILPAQTILVTRGRIEAIKPASTEEVDAKLKLDGKRFVALPGFVNTHTHLWQHAARSFEPSGQLQDWKRIYRVAHYASPDEIRDITLAAAGQAISNGITTVLDFSSINFADGAIEATLDALKQARIGGAVVWWRSAAFLPSTLDDEQLRRLKLKASGTHDVWMGPGPLSFFPLPAVYDGILSAKRNGLRLAEHSMENLQEARDLQKETKRYLAELKASGKLLNPDDASILQTIADAPDISQADLFEALGRAATEMSESPHWNTKLSPTEKQSLGALPARQPVTPVELLENLGALKGFVAIHSVWPTKADLDRYAVNGVFVSHNPESNMYLASGVSPVRAYQERSIPVTLGTDGAASNDRISMFDAMRTASMLQKVSALEPNSTQVLSSWYFIKAATINGAKALGIDDRVGSLKEGKEADIVLLDTSRLSLSPYLPGINDTALIVNSAEARDIAYVVADGEIAVDGGRITFDQEARLAERLRDITLQLTQRVKNGATWTDTFQISRNSGDDPWWRYRSVRKADTLALAIENTGSQSVTISVAFSGVTFGGTIAQVLNAEALKRFPMKETAGYWSKEYSLAPGAKFGISKKAGGYGYVIEHGSARDERNAEGPEQILLSSTQ